jgi:hypothetical protein
MPNMNSRPLRADGTNGGPSADLRRVVEDVTAIAPLAADIESRLEALPAETYDVYAELHTLYAILDIGRRLLAQRAAEAIEGSEMAAWSDRVTVAELAASGLPEGAVGVAWTSFEECSRHARANVPDRAGVQPARHGVILYGRDVVDCADCGAAHRA